MLLSGGSLRSSLILAFGGFDLKPFLIKIVAIVNKKSKKYEINLENENYQNYPKNLENEKMKNYQKQNKFG